MSSKRIPFRRLCVIGAVAVTGLLCPVPAGAAPATTSSTGSVTTTDDEYVKAVNRWRGKGWPKAPVDAERWYLIGGMWCRTNGEFMDRRSQLKDKYGKFYEYDVICHKTQTDPDLGTKRIVAGFQDRPMGEPACISYTADHYRTFERLGNYTNCARA
ncbi:ribonuclease domain-containing protein [Saccharothrix deserti]|uniref:ribonuclease domain-containing protein n=1 Tax=Saccharothrix deserti TaxID=2593674 RepID=UPI00131B92AA|nr:ribonuclease domain-containing protein [Saccharothrix deserti]